DPLRHGPSVGHHRHHVDPLIVDQPEIQDAMSATAAADMSTATRPPSALRPQPLRCSRITARLLQIIRITMTSGGASRPFTTADQTSNRIAFKRAKASTMP